MGFFFIKEINLKRSEGLMAGCKGVAAGLSAQPLAFFVLKVGNGVRLGLTQVIFQRVLLRRGGKKLVCDSAQRLKDGHVIEPEQAFWY